MARTRKSKPDDAPSRERILETAGRLFARKGYAATSVDEVAAEARTSKSSIYWHFKSKEEILLAVLSENTSNWAAEIVAEAEAHESVVDKLEAVLEFTGEQLQRTREFRRLVLGMMSERAEESPRTREVLQEIYQGYRKVTLGQIEKIAPQLPDAQRRVVAESILAFSDGLFLHWQLDSDNVDLDEMLEGMRKMLVPALQLLEQFSGT